jgi:hypothetical protein
MFSRLLPLVLAAFFLPQAQVHADIYSVTTTAESGPGSLGQAILDANAHPNSPPTDPDRIHFAIPGTDVQAITPQIPLPDITDPVVIDGFTQNGALPNSNPVGQGLNTTLKIDLDGFALLFEGNGLTITCGNTTIRGLIISRFYSGIACRGGSGNVIAGNFIGTDRTGTFSPIIPNFGREPRQVYGIALDDCRASRVGGRDPASRNLVAGNEFGDVLITGPGAMANVVEGNLMGTKASGMESLDGGSGYGVYLQDGASANLIGGTVIEARNVMASSESTGGYYAAVAFGPTINGLAPPFGNLVKGNFMGLNVTGKGAIDGLSYGVSVGGHHNVIGGTEPGARNIISGNSGGGMLIGGDSEEWAATENVIQGNFVGTDDSGTLPLGNGRWAIRVGGRASNNTIGGTEPGAGNRIAFTYPGSSTNSTAGTAIASLPGFQSGPVGNAILGNLIYGNEKLGIDLKWDGVTPNDPGDADIGPNNLQNYPVITGVSHSGGSTIVAGTLNSAASTTYRIELFANGGSEQSFLGSTNVTTDATGNASFNLVLSQIAATPRVSATATDPTGNTSEFSPVTAQLLNIATRLRVRTGENVLIGGFIVAGTGPKKVIIRAIGPSLAQFVGGTLANPTLELYQGNTLLQSNDDWKQTQQAEIEATTLQPADDFESAIVRTLPPGSYTAIVRGSNNTAGIGLVEAYDLDLAANSKLANISTRGFVETGDDIMIGGLIIGPGGSIVRVVLRAIGPSLSSVGVAEPLQDPTVDLKNANGATLSSNNDWQQGQPAELQQLGLAPTDPRESALVATLPAGNYTAIVRGNGNSTGVALVEIYHVQ